MNDRRFGVELEFNSGGIGRHGVAQVLREAFDREGLQRWYFMNRIDYDGSEIELRTPILKGKEGFRKLEVVMNSLHNAGCYATTADGMHVHHDAPEFINNIDNCIRAVKSWNANRHLIYRLVDPARALDYDGEYWACPKWSNEAISLMERDREIPYWDRNDFNLNALNEHGSIEIRLHHGTLNFTEAKAWILFGQRFLNRVVKHSMRDSGNMDGLLKKVRVNPDAKKVLIDKANQSGFYRGAGSRYYEDDEY